jgi:hypothetical protein
MVWAALDMFSDPVGIARLPVLLYDIIGISFNVIVKGVLFWIRGSESSINDSMPTNIVWV